LGGGVPSTIRSLTASAFFDEKREKKERIDPFLRRKESREWDEKGFSAAFRNTNPARIKTAENLSPPQREREGKACKKGGP